MLNLLMRYGNPVFPFANHIFESPWAVDFSYIDDRLMPGPGWASWTFPLAFARGGTHGWEVPFRDARIAVLAVAGLGAGVAWAWKRSGEGREVRFLLVFVAVSYVIWQISSSVYRYVGAVELLAPTLVVALVLGRRLLASRLALGLLALAFIGSWVQVPKLARIPFSGSTAFDVRIPEPAPPPGSIVLIAGADALSYILPSLDPGVRVLRPWSSLSTHADATETNRRIASLLAGPSGPVFLLEGPDPTVAAEVLEFYGFERASAAT
jgi:hypothetical protein